MPRLLQRRMRSNSLFWPRKKCAPLQYSLGAWTHFSSEDRAIRRETSCGNKPWGTNPPQNVKTSGHGSLSCGVRDHRSPTDFPSCAGTKYLVSSVASVSEWLPGQNRARKPYISIMCKTLCCSDLFPLPCKLSLNTLSIRCLCKTPVVSSFSQSSRSKGSW